MHSDSWNIEVDLTDYTIQSQQIDDFAWNHPDFVMVFPAGNQSTETQDSTGQGIPTPSTLTPPGTAKNCITVGATESERTTGWIVTYGSQDWGFPYQPIYGAEVSTATSGSLMAAWSGQGPCSDGRIKPDIVAPGTNIISCLSHAAINPSSLWWDPLIDSSGQQDRNYMYLGGTSMSTPEVAGAATLVREYCLEDLGIAPSSALVKAILLNGADDIWPAESTPTSNVQVPPRPNSVEGWGRLDVSSALDPVAPKFVQVVDEAGGVGTGQSKQYQYSVLSSGTPLRVTLVWTDHAPSSLSGKALVNELNLAVLDPGGATHYPNGGTAPDYTNNVQSVDISSPATGTSIITVSGFNVPNGMQPSGLQPYALVVSGALPGGYISGAVTTSSGGPVPGVSITVTGPSTNQTTGTGLNGGYSVNLNPNATYTVTPTKAQWTFNPASITAPVGSVGASGVNFTGSAAAGSIAGAITKALGGTVDYTLISPNPYDLWCDLLYTITADPTATSISVHFNTIGLYTDPDPGLCDEVTVYDSAGTVLNDYVGTYSESSGYETDWQDQWSSAATGNTIKIRLRNYGSDPGGSSLPSGFYIDSYQTNLLTQGGLSGVTVSAAPYGAASSPSASTGAYSISGLAPIAYNVTPSLGNWTFTPNVQAVAVSPGLATAGINFDAFPPATVSGTVFTTNTPNQTLYVMNNPPAPDTTDTYLAGVSYNESWTISGPTGTAKVRVHFPSIGVWPGSDYVLVSDMNGNVVDRFTSYLDPSTDSPWNDVWSDWVPGSGLTVKFVTDGTGNGYGGDFTGFSADKYQTASAVADSAGNPLGLPGATITLEPGGYSTVTDSSGNFSISVPGGILYTATASEPYWSMDQASVQFNAVPNLNATGIDFFAEQGMIPSVAGVKTQQDDHRSRSRARWSRPATMN